MSDTFPSERGIRLGDVLVCLLFNIVLEKAVRDADTGNYNKSVQWLANANDLNVTGRTTAAMKEFFLVPESAAKKIGLE